MSLWLLLLPAGGLVAVGLVVGWFARGYCDALEADRIVDTRDRVRAAFRDVPTPPRPRVIPMRRPYDWSRDGGTA